MSYYEERSTAFLVQNDMVESVKKQKTFLLSPKNIFWGSINSSVRFEDMIERAVWCCWNSSKQARIWLQLFFGLHDRLSPSVGDWWWNTLYLIPVVTYTTKQWLRKPFSPLQFQNTLKFELPLSNDKLFRTFSHDRSWKGGRLDKGVHD